MRRTAWAEIDLSNIRYNLALIRGRLGEGVRLCGVFKGDAYGHGSDELKRYLCREGLLDMVAVGKLPEMEKMLALEDPKGTEVLLLGFCEAQEVEEAILQGRICVERADFSIYNLQQLYVFREMGERLGKTIRVHIRVDIWGSGMGLELQEFLTHEEEIFSLNNLEVCGLYAHLYSSYGDDREQTKRELETFDGFVSRIRPEHRKQLRVHVLNSALTFSFPSYGYDMARIGTALYGLNCGDKGALRPAMRICATVFDVRNVAADAPLAYKPLMGTDDLPGGQRRIARIMAGYCDCPFLLTQKDVRVRIRDGVYPLADEVCMDNLCIDITGSDDIEIGDVAVLLGEDGVLVDDIIKRNDIAEVHADWMSLTTARLEKIYKGEKE